ncbi:hypothetical protein E2C01_078403 [Portunus trituberculatus]|uniref:Uncharacterized protein n=1 Tax=Portunus trituberculatus TaxID=210409 RepID=A0A5B7ISN6_PORTR|nr:hypothetical protein [Portunus trituberculatus]
MQMQVEEEEEGGRGEKEEEAVGTNLGNERQVLHLGLSVGGSQEWQVVEQVRGARILALRQLTHPRCGPRPK